jgi:hypothetical protein
MTLMGFAALYTILQKPPYAHRQNALTMAECTLPIGRRNETIEFGVKAEFCEPHCLLSENTFDASASPALRAASLHR